MISSSDQFHQLYSPISDEGTSFRETLFYGQNQRVEELNDRIYDRNKSDISLEPNFDPRSISTKYAKFPIIMTTHTQNTVAPIHAKSPYMIHTNFSPANRQGPVSGYLSNIDRESELKNQNTLLSRPREMDSFFSQQSKQQHPQKTKDAYIPSSQSDLYKTVIVSRPSEQPYPRLFERYMFDQSPHENLMGNTIGGNSMHNHTRTQLRGQYTQGFDSNRSGGI